jgi:hypothetical protein
VQTEKDQWMLFENIIFQGFRNSLIEIGPNLLDYSLGRPKNLKWMFYKSLRSLIINNNIVKKYNISLVYKRVRSVCIRKQKTLTTQPILIFPSSRKQNYPSFQIRNT